MGHSTFFRRVARAALLVSLTAAGLTNALAETTDTYLAPAGSSTTASYGTSPILSGSVTFHGAACPFPSGDLPGGQISIRLDGKPSHAQTFSGASCVNGENSLTFPVDRDLFPLGEHRVTAEYSGDGRFLPSVSAPITIKVTPQFSGSASAEAGRVDVGLAWTSASNRVNCRFNGAAMLASTGIPTAPPNTLEFPYGYFRYDIGGCTPASSSGIQQRMVLKTTTGLPAGSSVWTYGPKRPQAFPEWYELPAKFDGDSATVIVEDGGNGDQTSAGDGTLQGILAIAIPKVPHLAFKVEGLWWAGAQENGWGMTIAREDDRLFNAFFIYGDDGSAQWVVMPGGTWNRDLTEFTGDLYIPSGSAFQAYDVSRFVVGPPVGTATLRFSSADAGTLTYSIRGATGTKAIQRQVFGEGQAATMNVAALWWGGTFQAGWGLAVNQQGNTLFNVWYTYDATGRVEWYVMPGGAWISPRVYSGPLYRTRSSPWIGRTYDPRALSVTAVGSMSLAFDSDQNATLTYTVNGITQSRSIARQPF